MNRLPSEGKKVLVYTSDRAEPFVGEYLGGMWLIEGRDSCSGVIGWGELPSSEVERVFTESEVKKMLEEFAIAGDMGRVQAMIIAKRHGVSLNPA